MNPTDHETTERPHREIHINLTNGLAERLTISDLVSLARKVASAKVPGDPCILFKADGEDLPDDLIEKIQRELLAGRRR